MYLTNNHPLVSVMIPSYNGAQFIEETLESVLSQTYRNMEIIVLDDGSTDSTGEIVQSIANRDHRIIYKYQCNVGLAETRNRIVNMSKGRYVAFLDQDDLWLPTKIEKQVRLLENYPDVKFVYGNFIIYDEENKNERVAYKRKQPEGNVFERFLYFYPVGIVTVVVEKDVLAEMDSLFDVKLSHAEEYDVFMRILYAHSAAYIQEPLAKYRIHSRMTSYVGREKVPDEYCYVMNKHIRLLPEIQEKYHDAILHFSARSEYVRSQNCMMIGDLKGARRHIAPYLLHGWKWLLLYLMTFAPINVWRYLRSFWARGSFR